MTSIFNKSRPFLLALSLFSASNAFAANNAVLTSATYDTTAPKFGTAALSGGYATIPSPIASGPLTAEAWFKTSSTASGQHVIIGFDNGPWVGVQAGQIIGAGTSAVGASLADGAYHHLRMTVSSAGQEKTYVDGVLAFTSTGTYTTTGSFRLANFTFGSTVNGFQFVGSIDEAAVFTGLLNTANFTPPTSAYAGTESGLLGLYHLDSNGNDSTAAATTYAISGPASGFTNTASSAFSVQANGSLASSVTITPTDAANGGSFTPATITLSSTSLFSSFTYTPTTTGTKSISGTNSASLTNPTAFSYAVTNAPLAVGSLTAAPSASSIVLSLSASASGGAGGYSYAIYRGTDPNFTPATPLATVSTMPYTDTTAVAGTQYYYGVVLTDSSASAINILPLGLTAISSSPSTLLYASAALFSGDLCEDFLGDSITYGAGVNNFGTVLTPTVPGYQMARLKKLLGLRNIYGSNQGVSGYRTTNFLPGSSTYNVAVQSSNPSSGASTLKTAHPNCSMLFSIMLGTNDSYATALTPAQHSANLASIIDQIETVDWPGAYVIINNPPYYSPNTQNGASYLQTGLSTLYSYRASDAAMVAAEAAKYPGKVFMGDTYAYGYFSLNYSTELQADSSGPNGNFYLHPRGDVNGSGIIGTQSLGEMWATATANALYGVFGISTPWVHF